MIIDISVSGIVAIVNAMPHSALVLWGIRLAYVAVCAWNTQADIEDLPVAVRFILQETVDKTAEKVWRSRCKVNRAIEHPCHQKATPLPGLVTDHAVCPSPLLSTIVTHH
jgi:hypothetical protein